MRACRQSAPSCRPAAASSLSRAPCSLRLFTPCSAHRLALAPPRPAAAAAASKQRAPRRPPTCAAATEEDRDSLTQGRRASSSRRDAAGGRASQGGASSGSSNGRSAATPGGESSGPLLLCIRDCSSSAELLELLVTRAREVHGREVAAALEVAAQRSLIQPPQPAAATAARPRSSNGSVNGSSGDASSSEEGSVTSRKLASLLVRLATQHAADMEPAAASAAAWSLAAMQLAAAVPAVRSMHAVAAHQLSRYTPSQFCSLLWAGSRLDKRYRSPLFQELLSLLQNGLDLTLFSAQDLAVLALLCGRVRHAVPAVPAVRGRMQLLVVRRLVAADCSA